MPHARPSRLAVSLAAAVLVVVLWSALHPPRPHLATSDLYTHLSVARHLAAGDGFVCDVAYPLSFAFPWACELPQPLIHRPPGYALLLTPLCAASGRDPGRTLEGVRGFMALVLGASLWLGFAAFGRHRLASGAAPWSLLWLTSPLIAYALGWGQVETVAGCVLLALWLRWRDRPVAELGARAAQFAAARALPGWLIDGALCGALTLLRPELSWVPLWWWFGLRVPEPRSPVAVPPPAKAVGRRRRGALLVLAVWFAFSVPWAGRNWRVTGDPFFALQRHAEHVKGTAAWPEYSVYRSLEPQPLLRTVRADPAPLLTKTRAGIGFYLRELGHWLPWSLLAAGGVLWFARGRWRRLPREPLFVVGVTGAGLILGYAPFDHELRHLVPLWPVATWELCLLAAGALLQDGPRPAAAQRRGAVVRGALLTGAVAAGIWLTPARLPGWDNAAQIAARDLPRTAALVARADALPPGALFTDNAALLWLTGRTGAWAPLDAAVEAELRRRVPQLTDAPLLMMDGDRGSATENNGD